MLMTMRAVLFSTLVLPVSLGVLAVAVPAQAQVMAPGGDLDVYDDNDELVGRLLGIGGLGYYWHISVEAPDGDVGMSHYASGARLGTGEQWWTLEDIYFDSANCAGNAYLRLDHDASARSASGYSYVVQGPDVYRGDLNTAATPTGYSSRIDNGACHNVFGGNSNLHPAEFVGTISTAFPFHLRQAASSAPAVPPLAYGIIAGVLGMSGGWFAKRRRRV